MAEKRQFHGQAFTGVVNADSDVSWYHKRVLSFECVRKFFEVSFDDPLDGTF